MIESKLAPFDEFDRVGFWKMLTVREFSFDLMIIATATKSVMDTPELRKSLVDRFLSLSNLTQDGFRVTSVYWQIQEHAGDPTVYEHLGGLLHIPSILADAQEASLYAFLWCTSCASDVKPEIQVDIEKFAVQLIIESI